jgi:hypothetical protein
VDGVVAGSAVTNGSGVASLSYTIPSTMSVGAHTITTTFAGTNLYNASSGTGVLKVKAKTTVSVGSVTGKRGTTVTLSATLRRATDGVPLYGATLKFKVDGLVVGSALTDGSGVARLNYSIPTTMSVGTHTINAVFSGSSLYNASSGTDTLTVN